MRNVKIATRLLRVIGLCAVVIFAVLGTVRVSQAAILDETRKQEFIDKITTYIKSLTTVKSRFIQINPDGSYAEGIVYLKLPGKMRIEYDDPVPILMISDGLFLMHFDKKMKQNINVPLRSTPAHFLLRENPEFEEKVTVKHILLKNGLVHLTAVAKDNEEAGEITLKFSEQPLELKQWIVTDLQGLKTHVTLTDAEFDLPLDRGLFFLLPPKDR